MRKPGATPQVRRVEELGALKARNAIVRCCFDELCRPFRAQGFKRIRSRGVAPGYYISRLQREDLAG
jgi:hypothetical protein